jgi:cytochrome o ubiquinol oxidase subunit 2
MQEKTLRRLLWPLLALALPLALSGCGSALMDPKGQIGEEQRTLILTAFGLMMIVVIPVIAMTILFATRYHLSKKARYEPDWSHSTPIEIVVWLVPLVIIAFLGWLTWQTSHSLDPNKPIESDAETMEIQAVALDWKWLFIYPEQGIATVNEPVFPAQVPVHFRVSSGSVMNSFFIPRLGSQIYAMAGMDNDLHLIANEKGDYPGRSTNYSGAGFAEMTFDAHAVSPAEFDAWVDKVREAPQTLFYPQEYEDLARPTRDHPVEYFSDVSPRLYEKIIDSFRTGESEERDDGPMSAEAAE